MNKGIVEVAKNIYPEVVQEIKDLKHPVGFRTSLLNAAGNILYVQLYDLEGYGVDASTTARKSAVEIAQSGMFGMHVAHQLTPSGIIRSAAYVAGVLIPKFTYLGPNRKVGTILDIFPNLKEEFIRASGFTGEITEKNINGLLTSDIINANKESINGVLRTRVDHYYISAGQIIADMQANRIKDTIIDRRGLTLSDIAPNG